MNDGTIKSKQVDRESFSKDFGTRDLDKKIICIVIPDPIVGDSALISFPFKGNIEKVTILSGNNKSTGETKMEIVKDRFEDEGITSTIINDGDIILNSEKFISNVSLNPLNLDVEENDYFRVRVIEQAMIRPTNITVQIHVNI